MLYKVIYDTESSLVLSIEPITTTTIEIEDEAIYERFMTGEVRARVEDGQVVIDETEITFEENVVPSQRVAESLGIALDVGIPKAQLEQLAAAAGVSL
jgi:hypothetical protein